jgi:hypothetical protein
VEELSRGPHGVTAAKLALKLNLDRSSVARRARVAISRGYLKNAEFRKGQPAIYLVGEPLPDEIAIMPTPETLGKSRGGPTG